jgi:hypothetical protein
MTDTIDDTQKAAQGKKGFFGAHPRFLETSHTAVNRRRLNLRHRAIIEANSDILQGARVLDMASHDGRWSFAALKAGARHVVGIEAREDLVDNAERTFAEYGVDRSSYRFIASDLFAALAREDFEVDVVLCLGFYYHTLRYPELLAGIRRHDPQYLIVDTTVIPSQKPVIKVAVDKAEYESHATADSFSHGSLTLVGVPSMPALELMLGVYDFEVERLSDWEALADEAGAAAIKVYAEGGRITARCRRRST